MDLVDSLFNRLDDWRHLPNYQLERRADILFSLYLAQALEDKFGVAVNPLIVPEFPVRIGTIREDIPINKSFKIDYLAIAKARDTAYLVELKTDVGSRREKQDWYLKAATEAGMPALLSGLLEIYRATTEKRKYFQLFLRLEELELISIPEAMKALVRGENLVGVNEMSKQIQITCPEVRCMTVFVQPTGDEEDVISFERFRKVVLKHADPVSLRFAESLTRWEKQAGMIE
jgi:hypothetical protein